MSEPRKVQVGDDTYTLAPFKGFKALRAGRIVSRLSDQVPGLIDEMGVFARNYAQTNTVTVTLAQNAIAPEGERIPIEAFNGASQIQLPAAASIQQQIMVVLPKLLEMAEREVVELLALIVVSNRALEDADRDDAVDNVLRDMGRKLLHSGDLDELVELVVVGSEVLREQFAGKADRLGKLRSLTPFRSQEKATDGTKQGSSTQSPRPTDGPGKKRSTVSTGSTS